MCFTFSIDDKVEMQEFKREVIQYFRINEKCASSYELYDEDGFRLNSSNAAPLNERKVYLQIERIEARERKYK